MKLVIVSNRLPVSLAEKEGRLEFAQSPGGLASGLRTYLDSPRSAVGAGYAWVGWPGRAVVPDRQAEVSPLPPRASRPAPCSSQPRTPRASTRATATRRSGRCSTTSRALVSFDEGPWATYQRINEVFCDAVLEETGPDDTVWVHDYHLLLLPAMLRATAWPEDRLLPAHPLPVL